MAANMLYEVDGRILVLVHGDKAPTASEWSTFLDTWIEVLPKIEGLLVYSPGPGPDSVMRNRIKAALQSANGFRVSVITPSQVARGIVTAIRWLGGLDIKAFDEGDVAGAIGHLGRPASEAKRYGEIIPTWQRRLRSGAA